jgi:hypothetical protein
MFNSIRHLKSLVAGRLAPAWGPAIDETELAFHPFPWEADAKGGLSHKAALGFAEHAARNWLRVAGPSGAGNTEIVLVELGPERSPAPVGRLTVRTRYSGHDGLGHLLTHGMTDGRGRLVAEVVSRFRTERETEWSVFPPYSLATRQASAIAAE